MQDSLLIEQSGTPTCCDTVAIQSSPVNLRADHHHLRAHSRARFILVIPFSIAIPEIRVICSTL